MNIENNNLEAVVIENGHYITLKVIQLLDCEGVKCFFAPGYVFMSKLLSVLYFTTPRIKNTLYARN